MNAPTRTFTVPDISCDHCKRAIEDSVAPVAGVESVEVDVGAKTVTVAGGEEIAIEHAISEAGYSVA